MIGDVNAAKQIYIVCGYTDMRKSIDGMALTFTQKACFFSAEKAAAG